MSNQEDIPTPGASQPDNNEKNNSFSSANGSITPDQVRVQQNPGMSGMVQAHLGVQVHSGPLPPPATWNQYPAEAQKFWMDMVAKSREEAHKRQSQAQKDTVEVNKDGRRMGFALVMWLGLGCLVLILFALVLAAAKLIPSDTGAVVSRWGFGAVIALAGAAIIPSIVKGGGWNKS